MNRIIIFLFFSSGLLFSAELSNGYKDIKLGMSMDDVKNLIKKNTEFNTLREEILTIKADPDKEILSIEGTGYIKIAYFHFNKDLLYQIFLKFDETKIGYYTLLKNYTDKFGNATSFEPSRAGWENDKVRIVIEKPSTLKYFDKKVWDEMLNKDTTSDDLILKNRKDFIDKL